MYEPTNSLCLGSEKQSHVKSKFSKTFERFSALTSFQVECHIIYCFAELINWTRLSLIAPHSNCQVLVNALVFTKFCAQVRAIFHGRQFGFQDFWRWRDAFFFQNWKDQANLQTTILVIFFYGIKISQDRVLTAQTLKSSTSCSAVGHVMPK